MKNVILSSFSFPNYVEEMTYLPEVVLNEFYSDNFGVQWIDDAPYTTMDLLQSGLKIRLFSRWTTSLHGHTHISCKASMYYGMGQCVDARGGHPRQLNQDAEYEDLIHKQLVEAGAFADTPSHPDTLYSLLTKDMATEKIEASLLDASTLGRQQFEKFVMHRLTDPPSAPN